MKTRILLILLFVSGLGFAQIPTNNLLAMYEFTGGSYADTANGVNFTQTGTDLTTENDRFLSANNSISLNGDYLTRSDLSFGGTGTFAITWSFWIKTTTNTSDVKTILDDSSRDTVAGFDSDDVGYYIYLRNGKVGLSSRYYEGSFAVPTQPVGYGHLSTAVIADGNWHHIVVLFNPTYVSGSQSINSKIYVDGVEYAKSIGATNIVTTPNTNGNITLGNSRNNHLPAINTYTDFIDDIYAYNRVLTQTEIEQIRDIGNYCFKPDSNLISATNITQTSADITLTGTGVYDLAYHKASEPFSSAVIIPSISATTNLTGLDVFTDYNVYIREHCTVTTDWSNSILFKTIRPIGRLYVNTAATGLNTGVDWANALNSLTDALAIVEANEEIWVAQGTYKPDATDRDISFDIAQDDIKIYGGFNATETDLSDRDFINNPTILSGDLQGNDDSVLEFVNTTRDDNSYNIVVVTGNNTIIDGFTISDAHANGSSSVQQSGGAIFKDYTVPNLSINNCTIKNNVAIGTASGVFARYDISGTLKTYSTIFKNNLARHGSALYSYANSNYSVNVEVINSLFHNNTAKNNGSTAGYAGSAGWFRAIGNGSTMNCKLINNTYSENEDLGTGGSLNNFSRATVGMGYSNGTFNGEVSNCIFWGNTTVGGVTARSITGVHTTLGQNITVDYSIDQNNFASIPPASVTNSLSSDPLFTNAGSQDFSLQAGSPAIDSGDTTVMPFEISFDTSGNPRVYNSVLDRGALETACTGTCYQLTINVVGTGFVENNGTALTSVSLYNQNEVVNLQAIGNIGFAFSQWSGDATGSTNPLSVTMDADKTITVTFVQGPIYIDIDATGLNDGSSWANAFTNLVTASNAVVDENSTLWVAEGIYTPGSARTNAFNFNNNGLKVYGGFNGTETMLSQRDIVAYPTILSGDLSSNDTGVAITHPSRTDNAYHVVLINANNILLDGLTIKDGHANSTTSNRDRGAGIFIYDNKTSLQIKNCNIYRNACVLSGAGIYANYSVDTDLTIENCHIDRNWSRYGSGLYVSVSNASAINVNIFNSLFTHNLTRQYTNVALGYTGSSAWIRANSANSTVTTAIVNCTFAKNTDSGTQPGSERGTLAISRRVDGTSTANVTLDNSIIYENIATGNVVGPDINRGHTEMPNQVLVKNSIGQSSFSNINATNLTNTSNADPLFTAVTNDDYTLQAGSPAIDTGDNNLIPAGINTDLLGNNRIFNSIVDMGAYEYESTLGINNFEIKNEFTIYPNPTTSFLNIKMNQDFVKAEIYNIQGQKVLESKNKRINVSKLSTGMYLMKIETVDGNVSTKRFVKQ